LDALVLGHRAINRILVLKLVSYNYFRNIIPDLLDQPDRDNLDMALKCSRLLKLIIFWRYPPINLGNR